MYNDKKAFTLIELLVVIVVVGVLASLTTIALGSVRGKARDAKRISDIKQIQTALEMYRNDADGYPGSLTAGQPLAYGGQTYLRKVPAAPGRADGACTSDNYSYTQVSSSSYHINYCLGGAVQSVGPNTCVAYPGEICGQCTPNCATACGGESDGCGGVCPVVSCSWQNLGLSCFSDVSVTQGINVDADQSGNIYALMPDSSYPDPEFPTFSKGTVYKWNGSSWSTLGSRGSALPEGFTYDQSDIRVVGVDDVYLATRRGEDGAAYVRRYNGSWSTVGGVDFTGGDAGNFEVVVDSSDSRPVVFYYDEQCGINGQLSARKYNGTDWSSVVANCASDTVARNTVAYNIGSDFYVSYYNGSKVTAMKYSGSWSYLTPKAFSGVVSVLNLDMAMDNNNNPVVVIANSTNSNLDVYQYNGSSWPSIIGSLSTGAVNQVEVAVSSDNIIYVAYESNATSRVYVYKYTGGSWTALGGDISGNSISGGSLELVLVNNKPVVIYGDGSCSGKLTAKKYMP